MFRQAWPVLVLLLAGCSASGDDAGADVAQPDPVGKLPEPSIGAVSGVVLDPAVKPIADAQVRMDVAGEARETATDADGVFVIPDVPAGTYVLEVSAYLYRSASVPVVVEADEEVEPLRITLQADFVKQPYSLEFRFDGIIVCGYEAVLISAPCVTDYTSVLDQCPGGCAPDLRTLQGDERSYLTGVGPGWESLVLEMYWEPSAQGTSEEMGMLLSYEMRTAQHWFALAEGKSPLRLEVFPGESGPGAQIPSGMDSNITADGRDDLLVLGSVRAGENTSHTVGVGIQQKYSVLQRAFYYARPPADWSAVAGDEPPF